MDKEDVVHIYNEILLSHKRDINSNTIIEKDFSSPLNTMDKLSRQKINNNTQAKNGIID